MKRSGEDTSGQNNRQLNPRNRGVACCQCRQAKIRCELSSGGKAPCSRCRRFSHECEIDLDFKRVSKRVRLDELEEEVRQLRSSVSTLPPLALPGNSVHTPDSRPPREAQNDSPKLISSLFTSFDLSGGDSVPSSRSRSLLASPRSLGNVQLSSAQINALFEIYFTHYHPFTLLLDPSISPDTYFDRSELLFWTIIYTASRRYSDDPTQLTALTPRIKSLLWQSISTPPHTWYLVQSISLICLWPSPTSSLSEETTPVLVNIAQTISVELGLHHPESIQDFSRTKRNLTADEIAEVVRTWSVCYVASQSVYSNSVMSISTSDWMIDAICDEQSRYTVPLTLRQQLLIHRFSVGVDKYMSKSSSQSSSTPMQEHISMLGLLEQNLKELTHSLGSNISVEVEILLNSVELQLYVFYLLDNGHSMTRSMGLVKAFNLANGVIEKVQRLEQAKNSIKYCPVSYYRTIVLAALFILRLEDSNLAGHLDTERGKRAFHTAMTFLRKVSLEDNDLQGKSSRIFSQLWSMRGQSKHSNQEPRLKLRTRMAASLLHDQIWTWRESFGGQGSASRTPTEETSEQVTNNMSVEKAPALVPAEPFETFSFDDVFDAEMLSLLPFDLESIIPTEPVAPLE